jgi:hypothetical protein
MPFASDVLELPWSSIPWGRKAINDTPLILFLVLASRTRLSEEDEIGKRLRPGVT